MKVKNQEIKNLRLEKGWTQQQLAEITDLSLRTIQRVEKLGIASLESINALSSVYKIERKILLEEEDSLSLSKAIKKMTLRQKLSYLLTFIIGATFGSLMVLTLKLIR